MKFISKLFLTLGTPVILLFFITLNSYAYKGDAYVTPNTWNRHLTSNGVVQSMNGISFGDTGLLKIGLTTRAKLRFSNETDLPVYQYARLRLSGVQVGGGVNFYLTLM